MNRNKRNRSRKASVFFGLIGSIITESQCCNLFNFNMIGCLSVEVFEIIIEASELNASFGLKLTIDFHDNLYDQKAQQASG